MAFDEIDRLCARRAQDALKKYGILNLLDDPRDFRAELKDELLDGINYARWANVKGQIPNDIANGIVWILKSIISSHLILPQYQDNTKKPRIRTGNPGKYINLINLKRACKSSLSP